MPDDVRYGTVLSAEERGRLRVLTEVAPRQGGGYGAPLTLEPAGIGGDDAMVLGPPMRLPVVVAIDPRDERDRAHATTMVPSFLRLTLAYQRRSL